MFQRVRSNVSMSRRVFERKAKQRLDQIDRRTWDLDLQLGYDRNCAKRTKHVKTWAKTASDDNF
ncbi:hypothetical protein Bhyg_05396, partial [Pseudolycoriella hygida]